MGNEVRKTRENIAKPLWAWKVKTKELLSGTGVHLKPMRNTKKGMTWSEQQERLSIGYR